LKRAQAQVCRVAPRLRVHPFTMSWYLGFKLAVFLLLIVNSAVFAIDGTASEGLDSLAWLTLLLLFELETAHIGLIASPRASRVVHALRLAAGAAVVVAAIGYVHEAAWVDAANAWLWIAVVVLLESKVRFAQRLTRRLVAIEATTFTAYVALAALVGVWAWRGEWFDAYDAAIWLVAFVTIEMNVLEPLMRAGHPERR
jgi:hypothetical protein